MTQHGKIGFSVEKQVSGNEEQNTVQKKGNSDWLDAERGTEHFGSKRAMGKHIPTIIINNNIILWT